MRGSEVLMELNRAKAPGQHFIKWWRKENDFVDFELVKNFREHVEANQEFDGYELLNLEQMWQTLQKMFPERVSLERRTKGAFIIWSREGGEETELPYNSESVLQIFDEETGGDVID